MLGSSFRFGSGSVLIIFGHPVMNFLKNTFFFQHRYVLPKRSPFSAWGGKRSEDLNRQIRREQFSAWGGKRSDWVDMIKNNLERRLRHTRALNAARVLRNPRAEVARVPRASFSAWGGK